MGFVWFTLWHYVVLYVSVWFRFNNILQKCVQENNELPHPPTHVSNDLCYQRRHWYNNCITVVLSYPHAFGMLLYSHGTLRCRGWFSAQTKLIIHAGGDNGSKYVCLLCSVECVRNSRLNKHCKHTRTNNKSSNLCIIISEVMERWSTLWDKTCFIELCSILVQLNVNDIIHIRDYNFKYICSLMYIVLYLKMQKLWSRFQSANW